MAVKGFTRYGQYTIAEVLPHIGNRRHEFQWKNGHISVRMGTQRMLLFKRQQECQCCGLKGQYFALEFSGCFQPHFNMYGVNDQGHEVLLTVDHINPRSKGGKSTPENVQLLCTHCNAAKSNSLMSLEELKKKRKQTHGFQRKPYFIEHRSKLIAPFHSPVAVQIVGLNVTHHDFHLYHFRGYSCMVARDEELGTYEIAVVPGLMANLHDYVWLVVGNHQIERFVKDGYKNVKASLQAFADQVTLKLA
jgi:5-methylcytosine-specific restriction endonuclease McrA